jgi:hypothetical protein
VVIVGFLPCLGGLGAHAVDLDPGGAYALVVVVVGQRSYIVLVVQYADISGSVFQFQSIDISMGIQLSVPFYIYGGVGLVEVSYLSI